MEGGKRGEKKKKEVFEIFSLISQREFLGKLMEIGWSYVMSSHVVVMLDDVYGFVDFFWIVSDFQFPFLLFALLYLTSFSLEMRRKRERVSQKRTVRRDSHIHTSIHTYIQI